MWPKLFLLLLLAAPQTITKEHAIVNTPTDDVDAILLNRDVKDTVLVCVQDIKVECISVRSLRAQLFNRKSAN